MLSLRGVRKSYGSREVVCGIDLELSAGECFGLLGPNGAGKTTTLRLALGLSEPDAGGIRLLDYAIPARALEARMRVGVLPQLDNLDPDFTVFENLLVYGGISDCPTRRSQRASRNCCNSPGSKAAPDRAYKRCPAA
jgi:lipooligosaccharide transport system ATP-binding protein